MTIRIYIATTEGPVEVQRITKEDPNVRSVICLNGTPTALPISRAYDAFVKEPTGVIERAYEHPSYRMDVAKPITDGNSWQLGALIAHALFQDDRLATPEDNVETAIWLTGEVDRDLNVRPVDHIEEKLRASKALFDTLTHKGVAVFCFIPGGAGRVPDDDFLEKMGIDGERRKLEAVLTVSRIIDRFTLPSPIPQDQIDDEDIDAFEDDPVARPLPPKDNKPVKLLVLTAAVIAMLGGLYLQFEDNLVTLRSGSLKLGLSELRAHADKGCHSPHKISLEQVGASFPASPIDGLCALEISLNNLGSPAYLWAFAQRLEDGHLLIADRESLLKPERKKGLVGWHMVLPKNLRRTIDYRIVALISSNPLEEPVNRMLRANFGTENINWEKIKQQFTEEKVTVISALHSIQR